MKKTFIMRLTILLVIALAIGYTLFTSFSEERGLVDAGDVAPDFKLYDMEGNTVHLKEMRGQGVYITFWATYCMFCRDKMMYLKQYYEEYKEKGVQVLAVNLDESEDQILRFIDRFNVPYPIVVDKGVIVGNAYGVTAVPYTLLIDKEGTVLERSLGPKTEKQVLDSLEKLVPDL
ncbi:peroxiredoxin [Evansella vedderi]|uniref:Peroxiredoxin n=1 Tax=Evansella vedderi TaxID=38282 RepID=A0ABT9ZYP4_9BACI|nr:thiol-disulfide oxidoreductase ResA [Evansella vedderi]MDQ0256367.1 peroxiredoxin [Evansella vedderi]